MKEETSWKGKNLKSICPKDVFMEIAVIVVMRTGMIPMNPGECIVWGNMADITVRVTVMDVFTIKRDSD